MNTAKLDTLKIDPADKRRPRTPILLIFIGVLIALVFAIYYGFPRAADAERVIGVSNATANTRPETKPAIPSVTSTSTVKSSTDSPTLVVSGYIINRERIEISPRFQGVVTWIKVKKGDRVEKGEVVVELDASEQKARLAETEGRLAGAQVVLDRAELNLRRAKDLARTEAGTKEAVELRSLEVEAAKAAIQELAGSIELAKTYLEWTTIRSPISGVVLEKLVEPGELVVPQSFGGPRGPSTALIAVADISDLQVELDINESDLPKIYLGQKCNVYPEAYPEKKYPGEVVEIAPEANRQKGTLQIKVKILATDRYLVPELSARVEFGK